MHEPRTVSLVLHADAWICRCVLSYDGESLALITGMWYVSNCTLAPMAWFCRC